MIPPLLIFQDGRELVHFIMGLKKCNDIDNVIKFAERSDTSGGEWDRNRSTKKGSVLYWSV